MTERQGFRHPLTGETIYATREQLEEWRTELERKHGLDLATMSDRSVVMNYAAMLRTVGQS